MLRRLAALEGNVTDFSGLEQAISDQKAVDDQILARLDELVAAAGTSNAQGDQAAVQSAVVEMQQHIADVRAALASKTDPVPADPAPAADPAPVPDSAPADPVTPASGGDAVVSGA